MLLLFYKGITGIKPPEKPKKWHEKTLGIALLIAGAGMTGVMEKPQKNKIKKI